MNLLRCKRGYFFIFFFVALSVYFSFQQPARVELNDIPYALTVGGIPEVLSRAIARIPVKENSRVLWRITSETNNVVSSIRIFQAPFFFYSTATSPQPDSVQIVLEDGATSDRLSAATKLFSAIAEVGEGSVFVLNPTDIDFTTRKQSHTSTHAGPKLPLNLVPSETPLELIHQLVNFMHWPHGQSYVDEKRIADGPLWSIAQKIEAVDIVPGGFIARHRGGLALPPPPPPFDSFESVARAQVPVTDKVSSHSYGNLYNEQLSRIRARASGPVRFFEIGLGCGMAYGEGAGVLAWRAFFPNLELTVLEFDAKCLFEWAARPENKDVVVFGGDQHDDNLLNNIISARGPFDVIVDDGSHAMRSQIHSLEYFFPKSIVPGGVLFIEDLFSSMMHFGEDGPPYFNGVVADLADLLIVSGSQYSASTRSFVAARSGARNQLLPLIKHLELISCGPEICAFVRKYNDDDEIYGGGDSSTLSRL